MPATKSAQLRYKIIDRALRNKYRTFPTIEELRQACEDALFNSTGEHISHSTIEKDIRAMRNDSLLGFEAPIRFSKKKGGYYYNDPQYTIQELPLKDEELQAIRFAASTLHQFKEIPFFTDFQSAIEKIFSRVAVSGNLSNSGYDNFVQFEQEQVHVQADHLPQLLEAVINQIPVSFSYVKFGTRKATEYSVWPLLLKEYRNRWYLTCFVNASKSVLLFGLDRMHDLKIGKGTFERPANFDPAEYFQYSIGITSYNNTAPSEIVLSFTPTEGDYIRSKPLHASQKILVDNKKELRVQITVQQSYELEAMILSYGSEVKVLKPDSLVKKIKKRIAGVSKLYRGK